jgi:hypothetical protein
MHRAMLTACLPWLTVLGVSVLMAYFLLRLSRARLELGRLKRLHREQTGGVQSLSFVLTLPIFIMVMLLIVQVSQVMIGIVVVHYAAFAAVRSAIVWIPADLSRINLNEGPNRIGSYQPDPDAVGQAFPEIPELQFVAGNAGLYYTQMSNAGPTEGGVYYRVNPYPIVAGMDDSPKCQKILSAAVLACVPISPSQGGGYSLRSAPPLLFGEVPPGDTSATEAGAIIQEAYLAMSPDSSAIPAVPGRLQNKLAYALNNTSVELRFFHQNFEPPIRMDSQGNFQGVYKIDPMPFEFAENELGRQDLIVVKVNHNLALLPGPGRLLARSTAAKTGKPDEVADRIHRNGTSYYYPISASAALNVEGEKSVIPYVY